MEASCKILNLGISNAFHTADISFHLLANWLVTSFHIFKKGYKSLLLKRYICTNSLMEGWNSTQVREFRPCGVKCNFSVRSIYNYCTHQVLCNMSHFLLSLSFPERLYKDFCDNLIRYTVYYFEPYHCVTLKFIPPATINLLLFWVDYSYVSPISPKTTRGCTQAS